MLVTPQLPIQITKIFYVFWLALVPPHFEKGSATHDHRTTIRIGTNIAHLKHKSRITPLWLNQKYFLWPTLPHDLGTSRFKCISNTKKVQLPSDARFCKLIPLLGYLSPDSIKRWLSCNLPPQRLLVYYLHAADKKGIPFVRLLRTRASEGGMLKFSILLFWRKMFFF